MPRQVVETVAIGPNAPVKEAYAHGVFEQEVLRGSIEGGRGAIDWAHLGDSVLTMEGRARAV